MRKLTLLFFLLALLLSFPCAWAQPNASDPLAQEIRSIEERVKRIEEGQKEITERQKEILEAVQNLRAWIRST